MIWLHFDLDGRISMSVIISGDLIDLDGILHVAGNYSLATMMCCVVSVIKNGLSSRSYNLDDYPPQWDLPRQSIITNQCVLFDLD